MAEMFTQTYIYTTHIFEYTHKMSTWAGRRPAMCLTGPFIYSTRFPGPAHMPGPALLIAQVRIQKPGLQGTDIGAVSVLEMLGLWLP